MELGKLIKIENLRSIWPHEADDFTKWLASPENIQLLSDEIGINIKVETTEASVGSFYADILGEEVETGKKVIIENQIEKTNHDHLGKIITYGAGLEAEIIIWIVKEFKEEHKRAIDWLNEHTDDKISFFGINIELWQINNSAIAPKFNIISQPNNWAKTIKKSSHGELSENSIKLLDFLANFVIYGKERQTSLKLGKPQPATPSYYTIGIKTNEGWIAVKLNGSQQVLKLDYYFKEKEKFIKFKEKFYEKINALFNDEVFWDDLEKYKGATVGLIHNLELDKEKRLKNYDWIINNAEIFQKNLPKLLKDIS